MERIFVPLYRFFAKRRWLLWTIMLISFGVFVFFGIQVKYEEDISKLLPQTDASKQSGIAFGNIRVKDKIFIQIHSADGNPVSPQDLAGCCDELVDSILVRDSGQGRVAGILYRMEDDVMMMALDYAMTNLPVLVDTSCYCAFDSLMTEEALAVTNIVRSLSGLTFMTVMAFASACSSIVSNLIGEGHSREVWPTIMRHVKLTYLVVIPVLVVISLFPKVFLAIFTDVPQLVDASVASLWVMASSYLFLVPANCFFSSVSGTGQTRTAFRLELLSLVVYMAYITITIYWMRVDVALAWTAESVYGVIMMVLCGYYLKSCKWMGQKI